MYDYEYEFADISAEEYCRFNYFADYLIEEHDFYEDCLVNFPTHCNYWDENRFVDDYSQDNWVQCQEDLYQFEHCKDYYFANEMTNYDDCFYTY